MANRFDNNSEEAIRKLEQILNRVDQLPVLDNRSPAEIVGYDENGIPSQSSASLGAGQDLVDSAEDSELEEWRGTFGRDIQPAVKEVLEYRPRVGAGDRSGSPVKPRGQETNDAIGGNHATLHRLRQRPEQEIGGPC